MLDRTAAVPGRITPESLDTRGDNDYCFGRLTPISLVKVPLKMNALPRISHVLLVACLCTVALGGCSKKDESPLFVESTRKGGEAEAPVKDVPSDILSTQKAFSNVSKKVTPSVVNISTISRKKFVSPFSKPTPSSRSFSAPRRPGGIKASAPAS